MNQQNVFIKDDAIEWEKSLTLEEWLREMIQQRKDKEAAETLAKLPESLKKKLRIVWQEEVKKRNTGTT